MGISVTAAHTIFIVALLVGGTALSAAVLRSHTVIAEARRADAGLRDDIAHTEMTFTDQTWAPPSDRISFDILNEGSVVLDVRELDFVVDGAWSTDKVDSGWTVDAATTNWWTPGGTLEISLSPFPGGEPANVVVAAENGVTAVWRE